jgi:hypothetical protein
VNVSTLASVCPGKVTGGERHPGGGIHLNHVCGRAARMSGTFNALNRAEGRNTHFDGVTGVRLGEHLQQVAHGRGQVRRWFPIERFDI